MKEEWKSVLGFEEYFEISNLGRLKRKMYYRYNFKNGKHEKIKCNRIVTPTKDRGYLKVNLSVNGKRYLRYIHRLVAEVFITNPKKYKEVNHKDSNPSNNCVDNLEWCDRKYNINYMIKHQEEIKEKHEQRMELLENILFGIENGDIKDVNQVKEMIDEDLLGDY